MRSRLEAWEAAELAPDAVLVASELVTNAILHARTAIKVRVAVDGSKARIEVYDDNSRLPMLSSYGPDATSGRGLPLIAAIATSWGMEQQGDGKMVWAELGEPSPRPAEDCLDLTEAATVDQALSRIDHSETSSSTR